MDAPTNTAVSESPATAPFRADGLMFWLLAAMGFCILAPCVLVPEWKSYEKARHTEEFQRFQSEQLQEQIKLESQRLEAIRSDPSVVARLAQRDLGLYKRGERAILVSAAPTAPPPPDPVFLPKPVPPPAFVQKVITALPTYDYGALFLHERTRLTLTTMSTALIALAFVLFGRRRFG